MRGNCLRNCKLLRLSNGPAVQDNTLNLQDISAESKVKSSPAWQTGSPEPETFCLGTPSKSNTVKDETQMSCAPIPVPSATPQEDEFPPRFLVNPKQSSARLRKRDLHASERHTAANTTPRPLRAARPRQLLASSDGRHRAPSACACTEQTPEVWTPTRTQESWPAPSPRRTGVPAWPTGVPARPTAGSQHGRRGGPSTADGGVPARPAAGSQRHRNSQRTWGS